ncbi:MAG: zinc ribbon domain-containing protein [Theionarchaea archaeon]|nr:MAG: hypothetical protein AYK18_14900 [Theionarchaea archaeon DG-70]MBU7010333.1 zinc ribbon domain-containing protein [Theionarchaea archaeon]
MPIYASSYDQTNRKGGITEKEGGNCHHCHHATYLVLVLDENETVEFAFFSDKNLEGTLVDSSLQSKGVQIFNAIPSLGFERGIEEIMRIVEESKGIELDYAVIMPDSTVHGIYGQERIQIEDIKVDGEIISEFIRRYKAEEVVIVPSSFTAKMAKYIPNSVFEYFSNEFFSLEPAKEGEPFKGYTGIIFGGIIVLLIGIGIRIYRVRKKPKIEVEKTVEKKEVSASLYRYCPYCGSKVRPENVFCPICGKKQVEKAKTEKKAAEKEELKPKLICPFCKNEIEEHWVACPICGVKLKDDTRIY